MFSKVKISDIVNNSLNLAETKLYEVGLVLPCQEPMAMFVASFANKIARFLATPRVIA